MTTTNTTKTGQRFTLVSLAAIALLVGVSSGVAYSQADRSTVTEVSSQASDQVGAMEASRKVRCIMPAAWRQGCGA